MNLPLAYTFKINFFFKAKLVERVREYYYFDNKTPSIRYPTYLNPPHHKPTNKALPPKPPSQTQLNYKRQPEFSFLKAPLP